MEKTKGFIAEFKEFISRGSVIDLAVGVIIGGAFTTIVNSLVNDIVMPVIGLIIGGIDFTNLKYTLPSTNEDGTVAAICYGNFIQNVVNFLLIAFVIFCVVKFINNLRRKEEEKKEETAAPAAPAEPSEDILLLREIRDSLKNRD